MKMKIEWHEECLKNRREYLSRQENELLILQRRIDKDKTSAALYAAQIELAKKEKIDGFDVERYAIKRLSV